MHIYNIYNAIMSDAMQYHGILQSGASSLAKHGGAHFSAVYGSIKDLIAAPGPYKPHKV